MDDYLYRCVLVSSIHDNHNQALKGACLPGRAASAGDQYSAAAILADHSARAKAIRVASIP